MITTDDEAWATNTLRDAQDPGSGPQEWKPLTRITLERYNLIFAQQHTRGYASPGDSRHDAATALENGFATLLKVVVGGASVNNLEFTKWSVASGLEYDSVCIAADADVSDTARPSMVVTAGVALTIRVFYIDEDDDYIHYIESTDGGGSWGKEQNVGASSNLKAIASVSTTKLHYVTYANGNSRFHLHEYAEGAWGPYDADIHWPHQISNIDAITIGDRDLIVFFSEGPMYGAYREAGIYGIWEDNYQWSDIFPIDVLDEHTDYAYREHPMISEENGIYFLTGYLSEGDSEYSHATRFLKTSKDGEHWSQYQPLVTCPETGPAKLLVINAASGQSWPWSTGQQVYVVGYDKIYESDATRIVGEENADLQVDVSSRVPDPPGWMLTRGVISQATTTLSNHDGVLDNHSIIADTNTLLLKREAGYRTGAGDEYAQLALEQVDYIRETDKLPQRHKHVVSRDFMAWMRDREADHFEEWKSQLVGYDNYDDDTETAYGGLRHTATQRGRWQTLYNQLWLISNNKEGIAFATWDSQIMNGVVKAKVRIETASNGEYAGVIFRAHDCANLWAAYYDETNDKIYLRKKVADVWEDAVAESGTLSWSVDTWYGIMVEFRYSYIRVYYSADGLTWTEAFNYTVPINAFASPLEYGYVGTVGYGYSDQDEDEDAEYEPPMPPPYSVPPGGGGGGGGAGVLFPTGQTGYIVDGTSGRLVRSTNLGAGTPGDVIYENLGVVDAGGLNWIELDKFDPKNRAMVCGPNGIWRTTNLSSSSPTFTQVLDLSGDANDVVQMILSSSVLEDLWMASGYTDDPGPGHAAPALWWTNNFGGSWSSKLDIIGADVGCKGWAKLEMSSHHQDRAWLSYAREGDGLAIVHRTITRWASNVRNTVENADLIDTTADRAPCTYHRHIGNYSGVKALIGGAETTASPDEANVHWDTSEPLAGGEYDGTTTVLGTGEGSAYTLWVGGYFFGETYWALIANSTGYGFLVSDDALDWTLQNSFAGCTIRHCVGWLSSPDRFYMTMDGTSYPVLVSIDRGSTWQGQTGNWGDLGYDGDITCIAILWTE